MRTILMTAALAVTLAACGGDDGLSLTEPNQIVWCAEPTGPIDLIGTWDLEWGCDFRETDGMGGMGPCDPNVLAFADANSLTIAAGSAPDMLHVTMAPHIDGEGSWQPPGLYFPDFAGGDGGIVGCGDGTAQVHTYWIDAKTNFSALATRR